MPETRAPSEESTPTGASGMFVGRRREMAVLAEALNDTLSGHGRLVMLAGEPGIGKTRAAQELASYAETVGVRVFWGRCYEEEGAPPYWPWVQSLRTYIQRQAPERLRSEMNAGAAHIALILPEVKEKLPDLESPPSLEAAQARFHLFASITAFLKNAAQSQPLLLVLDDLHWADRSSLHLLEFLAAEIQSCPLMVLGTYRDVDMSRRHPLSETLGSLIREQRFLRVQLPGLTQQEVEQMIQRAVAVSPPPGLSATIHPRTEGNPLFVTEIIRMLPGEGLEESEDYITVIPEGVRDAIGRRLNRLSEVCNQVLSTASVVGREFDFKLVSNLIEEGTEDQVLEAFEEAIAARLVEEPPETMGRYRFTHTLIQETLAQELSTTRRARLHARIGQALEEIYGANARSHDAELAHHFAEAELVLGPAKLVRYSLLAGEHALAFHAFEDAITHFERGLVARGITLTGAEVASDKESADLLFGLARAKSATVGIDLLRQAFDALSRAFEYYAQTGNTALAVAAAEFPINPTGRFPGTAELMARALTLVPADSHDAGRILSRYGGVLGLAQSDYEGAQQALGRALSIARCEGDVPLEVQTLTYAADVSGQHLHWKESLEHGLRAIALARGNENNHSAVLSRWWTSVSLLSMGDLDGARPHSLALQDLAEKQSTPRPLSRLGFVPIISLSCLVGDWKAGREYSNRSLKVAPSYGQLLGSRVLLEHETGEFAQGEVYLERLLEVIRHGLIPFSLGKAPLTIIAVARITGVLDHLEIAEANAEALLSEQSITPIVAMYAKAGLALLAVQKADQSAAAYHYPYFLEHRGTMIWTVSSADRLLGLLSQTMGNMDQATLHFEHALAFCRKAGYRPELAWTCHDYAEALLQRNGLGDRPKALSLLNESLAISTELGMRPLMERVLVLQGQAPIQPTKSPAYPDGLSQREVEVLRLIAAGRTDRQIAKSLFISSRTVNNHVRNILNKTAVANRTEAATYAVFHGLVQTLDNSP